MKLEQAFTIGKCQVIPSENAIVFDKQEKQSLQPKFIEVLCYLAKHFPRLIPREELIENVWAGNNYVGEKALTNTIWHLRKNLEGLNNDQDVIETIRKVGYRLKIKPVFNEPNNSAVNTSFIIKKLTQTKFIIFAIAIMLTLTFTFQSVQNTTAFDQSVITQITKHPGRELFTSPSPDGTKIVYKWVNNQESSNLYIKDRDNPQLAPQQLTFGDAYVGHSVWSNDGQYLYFSRKSTKPKTCQVIQLKVITHQEKPIVDCPLNSGYYYIDISPDDKTLAFHGYKAPADSSGIYFVDLTNDDSQPVRFSCSNNCGYKDRDFAFSPDGKSLAITRRVNRFSENIYLVNIATHETEQLTFDEEDIVGLAWHSNGERLIYGAQRADIRRGYILNIDSQKATNLQINGFSYPAFSKQSNELFYQQRTEKYHLASLSLNSNINSSPFPVIESKFSHQYPHYSNQSKKIAYVSNESGFYELWVSDSNGQTREQLTFLKHAVHYPRWSHDGEKIAFLAPVEFDKAEKIYIYDITSKTLSIVPSIHQKHNRPTWSWDDKSIISAVYENEYTDLHQIDISTGRSERLSFSGSRYGMMISPTTLLFTTEKKGLWQKEIFPKSSIPNKPFQRITGDKFTPTYSWEYANEKIYFTQTHLKHHQISFYDFSENHVVPLFRLPRYTLASSFPPSIIKERNQLLFTQAESPQADIKKIEHPLLK